APAAVEVDGRAAGDAPAAVQLGIGQHVVVVRRPGFAPRGQAFLVRGGGADEHVTVALERDAGLAAVLAGEGALAVGRSDADARVAIEGLLLWGELDGVLLVASAWRRAQPALLGQLCQGDPLRCTQVEEVGYPAGALAAGARQLLARLRGGAGGRSFTPYLLIDRRLVEGERAPGAVIVGGGKPGWYRNPYLWLGVGAAALAAGAWAVLGGDATVRPVVDSETCQWLGGC
ncbi:MAG TPA: hypothetical protein VL172_18105, partial [Kofleriaceae bacterium]|nr:hypothetical protein [Kofleriaceae bacterium]